METECHLSPRRSRRDVLQACTSGHWALGGQVWPKERVKWTLSAAFSISPVSIQCRNALDGSGPRRAQPSTLSERPDMSVLREQTEPKSISLGKFRINRHLPPKLGLLGSDGESREHAPRNCHHQDRRRHTRCVDKKPIATISSLARTPRATKLGGLDPWPGRVADRRLGELDNPCGSHWVSRRAFIGTYNGLNATWPG